MDFYSFMFSFPFRPDAPDAQLQRALLLLTKIIQNVANGVQFGAKEQFMTHFNGLVTEFTPQMTDFLASISVRL